VLPTGALAWRVRPCAVRHLHHLALLLADLEWLAHVAIADVVDLDIWQVGVLVLGTCFGLMERIFTIVLRVADHHLVLAVFAGQGPLDFVYAVNDRVFFDFIFEL
jgi:hypothetical protein